jgi:hypothetical protein
LNVTDNGVFGAHLTHRDGDEIGRPAVRRFQPGDKPGLMQRATRLEGTRASPFNSLHTDDRSHARSTSKAQES